MTRVLVVDDEPQILRALRINLRVRDYEVDTAATGGQALEAAGHHPPDLVILDLGLPDMDGGELLERLRAWSSVPLIVLSVRSNEAESACAPSFSCSPFSIWANTSFTAPAVSGVST